MKKQYEAPFMETIVIQYEDVVTGSLDGENQGFGNEMTYDDFFATTP